MDGGNGPVRAGSISLWLEREGRGAPLLLITGLGYASWCWLELRARLRDRCELLAFDNRGTGRSDKPPGPYSIGMLADDAAAVLMAAGVKRAHVLGHSMGGYIALTLARAHPGRVRSLVLVGTSRGGPDTSPSPPETLAAWQTASKLPPADYARRTMPLSFAPGWTDAHADEFERILARRLEFPTPASNWLAQYNACAEYVTRGLDVRDLPMPSLVIHGQQDRVVPHRNGELLAADLPRARLVSLERTGHLPFLEDPAGFAKLVGAFLEEQP